GPAAQEEVEPRMKNLVGQMLDEFRNAGTGSADKHLGEDPTAKDLEDVRREFRAKSPPPRPAEQTLVPVTGASDTPREPAPKLDAGSTEHPLVAEVEHKEAPPAGPPAESPAGGPAAQVPAELKAGTGVQDLGRLKEALKS